MSNFSLLTLNLHTYQQHRWDCPFETMHQHEREVQIIAEAIAALDIDVICFQEVGEYMHDPVGHPYGETPSNMAFRICTQLRNWNQYYHIYQDWSHIGFDRWREGSAILSRHPMMHNYSAYVSDQQGKDTFSSRNVTLSCIDVPNFGLLHVSNVHLSWVRQGINEEFNRLKALIDSRLHFGVRGELIVGDFNAPAGEHAYHHMVADSQYIDQFYELHPQRFYEPSYRGEIDGWKNYPPSRLDYILKRDCSDMQIQSMDVIFNDDFYPTVSDHFAYLARFQLF